MGPRLNPPPAIGRPPLSARKRGVFCLLIAVGLYGVMEASSFFFLWALDHQPFSFRLAAAERRTIQSAGGGGPSSKGPTFNNMFVLHPYLGMVLKRGWSGPFPYKGPISEYGFIDPHSPVHRRAPGKVVVGIVGGSLASNFFTDGLPGLEQELRKDRRYAGKKFEFANLAVYAYKQPQQIMALNYALALGAEFDLIINLDGYNEIALYSFENAAAHVFPLYPVGWQRHQAQGEVMDLETCVYAGRIDHLMEARAGWAELFDRQPLRYCLTAALLWKLRDRSLEADLVQQTVRLATHRDAQLPAWATGPRRRFPTEHALFEELADIWKRCSLQLDRICKGHGIRYYHFLQPNQYVPGSKPMGPQERRVAILENLPTGVNVVMGYPYLQRAARDLVREGVHFHDLTRIFAHTPEPLYGDNCCHINARGNALLGRAIARAILETGEPPYAPSLGSAPGFEPSRARSARPSRARSAAE